MANLTVEREIEVKVNMNQLVCGQALVNGCTLPFGAIDNFHHYINADKVKIAGFSGLDVDDLFTGEDERDDYIEGSLEKVGCKLTGKVYISVKAKKYEDMIDEVLEKFKLYLEEVLPSYANIEYVRDKWLGFN